MYEWNWRVIELATPLLLRGAVVTLWITLLAVLLGTSLGVFLAAIRRAKVPALAPLALVYIELFRAIPILVLLIWIYYVLPIFFDWRISSMMAAVLALALNLAAFVAETVRAGLESVPAHQEESALALGMTRQQVMVRILFPQALRNMTPNLMGLYVAELKNASLASIIAVNELLHRANILISETFRPLELYTMVAVVYLLMIVPLIAVSRIVERRLAGGARAQSLPV